MSDERLIKFTSDTHRGSGRLFLEADGKALGVEAVVTVRGVTDMAEQLRLIDRALTAAKSVVLEELVKLRDAERKDYP
jgi:ABC-type sugar transport system substrate-binding protein